MGRRITLKEAYDLAGKVYRDAEKQRQECRDAEYHADDTMTEELLDKMAKEFELARTEIIAQRAELVRIAAMVQQVQMEMTGIREMIEDRSQH